MHVRMWFEYFDGQFDNKEGDFNGAHPFLGILRYNKGSDVMEDRVHSFCEGGPT